MHTGFYGSRAWQALRARAIHRDGGRCLLCGADVSAPGAARVDHIRTRASAPWLELDLSNVRTLCTRCDAMRHAEKGRSPQRPLQGANAQGWPTAPGHHWNRAPPAHAAAPPGGDQAPPAHATAPPAGGQAPPAHATAPPAGGQAPPAHATAPPAGGQAPPAAEARAPAGHTRRPLS